MSYFDEAIREWVWNVGRDNVDRAWLLSDYDTWHANPFYTGPEEPHPESYGYGEDGEVVVSDCYRTNEENLERINDWATDYDIPF